MYKKRCISCRQCENTRNRTSSPSTPRNPSTTLSESVTSCVAFWYLSRFLVVCLFVCITVNRLDWKLLRRELLKVDKTLLATVLLEEDPLKYPTPAHLSPLPSPLTSHLSPLICFSHLSLLPSLPLSLSLSLSHSSLPSNVLFE